VTTLEAVANVFFVLWGAVFLVFRDPLTNYMTAMYSSWGLRPARWQVYWVMVVGSVVALMVGGLGLLGIR